MFSYQVLDIIISLDYFILREVLVFNIIYKLSSHIFKENNFIKKYISATRLHQIECDILQIYNNLLPTSNKEYTLLIKIISELLFKNIDVDITKISKYDYKTDKLDPLTSVKYCLKHNYTRQINKSIYLKLGLDHSNKPDNIKRIHELFL